MANILDILGIGSDSDIEPPTSEEMAAVPQNSFTISGAPSTEIAPVESVPSFDSIPLTDIPPAELAADLDAQKTGAITEQDRLKAAQMVMNAPVQSEPVMVDKKVGSESTSTTQITQSPESRAAMGQMDQAAIAEKAALDQEAQAAAELNKVNADRKEEDSKIISQIEGAKAEVLAENRIKFQKDLQTIDSRVAELAAWKPEQFWGSKSTAGVVAAAISVGLGGFSQALLGSGQNVGMHLLDRQMDEFDRNQQAIYNNKLKQIQQSRVSLETKMELAEDVEKEYDAMKLGKLAQIQGQFIRAESQAKTMEVQAGIQQKKAAIDMKMAKAQADIAAKYEAKVTQNVEKDVLKKVQSTPGLDKNGNPLKRTEAQDKSKILYSRVAGSAQAISGIDEVAMAQDKDYADIIAAERFQQDLKDVSFLGTSVGGVLPGIGNILSGGTPRERLVQSRPDIVQYMTAKDQFISGLLRKESGAAINPQEYSAMDKQMFPQPGDTKEIVAQKAKLRKDSMDALRESAAVSGEE